MLLLDPTNLTFKYTCTAFIEFSSCSEIWRMTLFLWSYFHSLHLQGLSQLRKNAAHVTYLHMFRLTDFDQDQMKNGLRSINVTWYLCHAIWLTWLCSHNGVNIVVADGLGPNRCQDICNHRDDIAQAAYIRSTQCNEEWRKSCVLTLVSHLLFPNPNKF